MWVVDTRKPGEATKIHLQEPGELVTHEDWWIDDQLTFCGGYLKEESHVKLVSIHDQKTRIIGLGAWWEGGTPAELSKYNWWHASGARDSSWVVTDNWHGQIAVIDANLASSVTHQKSPCLRQWRASACLLGPRQQKCGIHFESTRKCQCSDCLSATR